MSGEVRISRKAVRWASLGLVAALAVAAALVFPVGRAQAGTGPIGLPTITNVCSSYSFTGQIVDGIPIYRCVITPEWRATPFFIGYCVWLVGVFEGDWILPFRPVSVACPGGGDGRVNAGHGDHIAAVYVDQGEHALPDLKLYCIKPEVGTYAGEITQAMIPAEPPAKDTLIKTFDKCSYPVRLYALTTGQLQLNFGPDAEGHTAVMTFTGIPPADVSYYDLHLYP